MHMYYNLLIKNIGFDEFQAYYIGTLCSSM